MMTEFHAAYNLCGIVCSMACAIFVLFVMWCPVRASGS